MHTKVPIVSQSVFSKSIVSEAAKNNRRSMKNPAQIQPSKNKKSGQTTHTLTYQAALANYSHSSHKELAFVLGINHRKLDMHRLKSFIPDTSLFMAPCLGSSDPVLGCCRRDRTRRCTVAVLQLHTNPALRTIDASCAIRNTNPTIFLNKALSLL